MEMPRERHKKKVSEYIEKWNMEKRIHERVIRKNNPILKCLLLLGAWKHDGIGSRSTPPPILYDFFSFSSHTPQEDAS